ncbi:MAG: flagellar basal-body MS-ring/collar protein FliF [Gemmatales bacterium]|nr:flagellar basal-body MS-ring/collar protein FliF [Gemmatales bacterium]MDW8175504.1 flagellar basal-body MS-ring/collar protein FliF [Gemmatales bacterium]MDW8222297.1 flagellar basal-body MS-ring/collar protein FliF [Gemmatales bacterium]
MNTWQQLREQISRIWQGLSWPRRALLGGVGLALVLACIALVYWAMQPEYRVLYSGLALEDSGAITARLQAQNIPYRLENQGTTILVPVSYHQQALVDLARAGLPARGGKTFDDLFDQGTPFGLTPFLQQVNYLRALQTELARTIMQMEPVAYARVHITRPEPSPFVRERKPVTASVLLRLKPGMTLPRNTAAAIVALVSRSVEGLAPEHVTLVDSQGRLLSEPVGDAALSGSLLERKREYETYLASEAEKMLATVLGPGKALVRVSVEFNNQTLTEKAETYNLEQKPVRRSETVNEKSTGTSGTARGPAGVASNLARTAGAASQTASEQRETETTEYYPPPKTEITRVQAAGQIERLTVAVMVDLSAPTPGKPPIALADVQEIVKQAVGFKAGRDEIKVTQVQFPPATPSPSEQEWWTAQNWERYLALAKAISFGLVGLCGLAFAWLLLRRGKTEAAPAAPAVPGIAQLAQQQPEVLAQVIARWLEEGQATPPQEATTAAASATPAARPPLRAAA